MSEPNEPLRGALGDDDDDPGSRDPELAALVGSYMDRLVTGERVTADEVRREHPERADELLEELRLFIGLEETAGSDETALGSLGDYTLCREIGRGGMGVVYEAWERSLDRRVALKVLPPAIAADTRSATRFLREAQIVAKLSHPRIVPVHATGVKDGTPWYAMEFIEGETLGKVLGCLRHAEPETETPFGPKDRVDYFAKFARAFADVADGLQHAHAKGVVHRDIKPSNLILDREGRLRILDFGLARLEGQESITLSGDFVGTPLYMSPEQARRKKVPVDHRTDVYSLGATMYEVLCGRPPFRGKDHADTLSQIIERDPLEPRKVNPRVPKDLETIVLKCLRKDAGERYGTAEAVGQDLRRFVRGDPVEARPQSRLDILASRLLRHWRRVAVGAMAALLFAAFAWLFAVHRKEQKVAAAAEYERLVRSAVIDLEFGRLGGNLGPGSIESRQQLTFVLYGGSRFLTDSGSRERFERARRTLRRAVHMLPDRSDAHYHLVRAAILLGLEQEAIAYVHELERCRPDLARLAGHLTMSRTSRTHSRTPADDSLEGSFRRAEEAMAAKRWDDAAAHYTTILRLTEGEAPFLGLSFEAMLGRGAAHLEAERYLHAVHDFSVAARDWPGAVLPSLFIGQILLLTGRKTQAEHWFQDLFEQSDLKQELVLEVAGIYGRRDPRALRWIEKLDPSLERERARLLYLVDLGRDAMAVEAGEAALDHDHHDALTHALLGVALSGIAGEEKAAFRSLDRARDLDETRKPLVPFVTAWAEQRLGRTDEAMRSCRIAVERDEDFVWARHLLAYLCLEGGEHAEARRIAEECLARDRGDYYGQYLIARAMRWEAADLESIETAYQKALELNPRFLEAKLFLAIHHLKEEERVRAIQLFREVLAAKPQSGLALEGLGTAFLREGRFDEALAFYCRAMGQLVPERNYLSRLHDGLYRILSWPAKVSRFAPLDDAIASLEKRVESGKIELFELRSLALAYLFTPAGRDLQKARAYAQEVVTREERPNPESWATLAMIEEALGRRREAIAHLEYAATLPAPGVQTGIAEQLAEYRRRVLPDLLTFASVDGFLESHEQREWRPFLEAWRAGTAGSRGPGRYFEGRLAQLERETGTALTVFRELAAEYPAAPEPLIRAGECLVVLGRAGEAEELMRQRIHEDAGQVERRLWEAWIRILFAELGLGAPEVLERLPESTGGGTAAYAYDTRRLLEQLSRAGVYRMNAGGGRYVDGKGNEWERGSFFLGGRFRPNYERRPKRQIVADVRGAIDGALYQSQHWFEPEDLRKGYRIPLPRGRYTVIFHFAQILTRGEGKRVYDIVLEGEVREEAFDPGRAGFQRGSSVRHEVEVTDGFLDIALPIRVGISHFAALEVYIGY